MSIPVSVGQSCSMDSATWSFTFHGQEDRRPHMVCSPIMCFCLLPGEVQNPTEPPIWSILVYMLLTEKLKLDDKTVEKGFGLTVSVEGPSSELGSKTDGRGLTTMNGIEECESGTLTEVRNLLFSSFSHHADESLQAPDSMAVRCLDGNPIELTLVDTPISRRTRKQYHRVTLVRVGPLYLCRVNPTSSSHSLPCPRKIKSSCFANSATKRPHTISSNALLDG